MPQTCMANNFVRFCIPLNACYRSLGGTFITYKLLLMIINYNLLAIIYEFFPLKTFLGAGNVT